MNVPAKRTLSAALALSGADVKEALYTLRSYLVKGEDEDLIAKNLGLRHAEYVELKQLYYAHEIEGMRQRTTEHVYIDYLLAQSGNVKDLTNMIAQFGASKQYNALVGAVKVRAEIQEKIIERGQDFGFIDKKVQPKLIAGIVLGNLSDPQLKDAVKRNMASIGGLMDKFSDKSILDLNPGQLHTDDLEEVTTIDVTPSPQPQVKRHARNKVNKGRKVAKK